ncbi:MAG: hypothetical protein IJH12_08260 [Clostridia bacterium]|nr:hypothetical protein [Clostridia bacterium]
MKKYMNITIILFMVAALLSGCGESKDNNSNKDNNNINQVVEESKNVNVDDIYMSVLKDETKYISEENKEILFSEYMSRYEGIDSKVEYTLFDFDRDNENEMIIRISSFDGFYLILNYEDGTVYGFEDVFRGMTTIKEDGTHIATGGAEAYGIIRSTFEKNKKIDEVVAEDDMGTYKVNGKAVSEEEFRETWEKECTSKKDVEFNVYVEKYEAKSSSKPSTTTETKEQKSSFTEGTYKMTKPSLVGTEAEGYDTTITFSNGNANYLESYWEAKKSGTYTVSGDTLTINYTLGNEVNSIEGDLGTKTINETEIYKINGTKLTIESTTADSYTKAGDIVFELK